MKIKTPVGRNHRKDLFENLLDQEGKNVQTFPEEMIKDWYRKCNPKGSGPLGLCKMLCAALEEITELKGYQLPKD